LYGDDMLGVRNKSRLILLIQMLVILAIYASSTSAVFADTGKKTIIILNSYHRGYQWTDGQCDSIMEVLNKENKDYTLYVQ
jgi:hypothetical protein